MSLRHDLQHALNNLGPFTGGLQSLTVVTAANRLELELSACDQLAVAVRRFAYITDQPQSGDWPALQAKAGALAARLNYLLEPIQVIEQDTERGECQLRSSPPSQDDHAKTYYEVLARRDGFELARYQKMSGEPRQRIPAALTREVLFRLADDFAAG